MRAINPNSNDRAYRNYLASKSWECPQGGSHYWLPWQKDVKDELSGAVLTFSHPNKWQCKKCGQEKAIEPPTGHWSQTQVRDLWGMRSDSSIGIEAVTGKLSAMQQVVLSDLLEN